MIKILLPLTLLAGCYEVRCPNTPIHSASTSSDGRRYEIYTTRGFKHRCGHMVNYFSDCDDGSNYPMSSVYSWSEGVEVK